ncbi:MAG: hypothetical protein MJ227_01810 [Bacilli bacterium]|nr:hypothetical protein [Bacilli bacterium]
MEKFLSKKHHVISTICLITGLLAICTFIYALASWSFPKEFYLEHPGIEIYSGENVVSRWANLVYLTYIALVLAAVWMILISISLFFNFRKLFNVLTYKALMVFVVAMCGYIMLLYDTYQIFSGQLFGAFDQYHNNIVFCVILNIFNHFAVPLISMIMFFQIPSHGEIKIYHHLLYAGFAILYMASVKLVGLFAFPIEWYPYPIFDMKTFAESFHLTGTKFEFQVFMLEVVHLCLVIIFSGLCILFSLLKRIQTKSKLKKLNTLEN